jgi:hypothetical protein
MNKRPSLNIQREGARLKNTIQELTLHVRKFAPRWDRISDDGRMAIGRATARSLRAANLRVSRTNRRLGQILEWLDRFRQAEKAR